MSQYPNFETPFLMELLAHHTRQLTQFFGDNNFGKEYEDCKAAIEELQSEIRLRKKNSENPKSGIELRPGE